MSLLDDLNAGGGWRMPGATKWRRLRARKAHDPYSGEQTGEDWSNPETLISPALSPAQAARARPTACASRPRARLTSRLQIRPWTSCRVTGFRRCRMTGDVGRSAAIRVVTRMLSRHGSRRLRFHYPNTGVMVLGVMVKFNDRYFDELLNSAGVKAMTRRAAEKTLEYAKAHAPVDNGDYRDGLQIEEVKHEHRTTCMVVGTDPKTLLVESKTGNLRKALKAGKT